MTNTHDEYREHFRAFLEGRPAMNQKLRTAIMDLVDIAQHSVTLLDKHSGYGNGTQPNAEAQAAAAMEYAITRVLELMPRGA